MKARRLATLAVVVAVALLAAAPAMAAGLDPSFGRDGSFAVSTPKYNGETPFTQMHLAVAPGGSSYVQQGSWILAFGATGKTFLGFDGRGRLLVTPKGGKLKEVGGVAVDSQGRLLVAGTLTPASTAVGNGPGSFGTEAFVIRYLQDGRLDPTFGTDGEVDTTFGLPAPALPDGDQVPIVEARRIAVDAEDRPVVAATTVLDNVACPGSSGVLERAILARLNPDGSIDTSFGGGTGYADLTGEDPTALRAAPGGGWATLSGPLCAASWRRFGLPTQLSVVDEEGAPSASLDPARAPLPAGPAFALDQQGRVVYAEERPKNETAARVFRLLASGDPDPSFGQGGSVGLGRVGAEYVGAVAVDKQGRIVVSINGKQLGITRLTPTGQIETGFGGGGAVRTRFPGTCVGEAIAIDSRGRILVAGQIWTGSLKNNKGVAIARFLPGS